MIKLRLIFLTLFTFLLVKPSESLGVGNLINPGKPIVTYAIPDIVINEFMASNNNTDLPGFSGHEDWIELKNNTNSSIDISGYYITDNLDKPTKVQLSTSSGSLIIPAKGYLLLICSGRTDLGSKHIDLGLSVGGEQIGLYATDGSTLIDSITFGSQRSDISMGRNPNNLSEWRFFSNPTPGSENNMTDSFGEILPTPLFSHQGGAYSDQFQLSISVPAGYEDATIYYTLDGSEPNPDNLGGTTFLYRNKPDKPKETDYVETFEYSSPFLIKDRNNDDNRVSVKSSYWGAWSSNYYFPTEPVSKGTVVKAALFRGDGLPQTDVNTYYIYENGLEVRYTLPVYSLSLDERYMFDYDIGMYTPGAKGDKDNVAKGNFTTTDFRYPGHLEGFQNGVKLISRPIEVKIHGGSSKALPLKSLRIYGGTDFDNLIFGDEPEIDVRNIIFRSGSQNWKNSIIKDAVNQNIMRGLNFTFQRAEPVILFINGEFWGIHNIRERLDKHYVKNVYGVSKDSLDVIKVNRFYHVNEGDNNNWNQLNNYIDANNLSSSSAYNHVVSMVDIENIIDYYASQIFIANRDWPFNNVYAWRKKLNTNLEEISYEDGRWRWVMYDTDLSRSVNFNSFNPLFEAGTENRTYSKIFRGLMNNEDFQMQFITRFTDLLNTAFLPERTTFIINEFKQRYVPEIEEHLKRWRDYQKSTSWSLANWESEVDALIDFYNARPNYQFNHISSFYNANYFNPGSRYNLTVDVSNPLAGYIKLNTLELVPSTAGVSEDPYPWTGSYYKNVPVTLTAGELNGGAFLYWEKDGSHFNDNSTITINLSENQSYKAVYSFDLVSSDPFPIAAVLDECGYSFKYWSANSPEKTYPENMSFVYFLKKNSGQEDHFIGDKLGGLYEMNYNEETKNRINGLGEDGISFINTGSDLDDIPDAKLGGAILALNTVGQDSVLVSWTGGTLLENDRKYRIRLQYRIGDIFDFQDLLDKNGEVVEYKTKDPGHETRFEGISLPVETLNQPYVQLLWRYYYSGSKTSGKRSQLRLDDIEIKTYQSYSEELTHANLSSSHNSIESRATVLNNTTYNASKSIVLNPGFNTHQSVVFKANIKQCD